MHKWSLFFSPSLLVVCNLQLTDNVTALPMGANQYQVTASASDQGRASTARDVL